MDTRITRKQRRILITVFSIMLILLSSCDPVSYPTLPEQQMDTSSESTAESDTVTGSLTVEFEPVLGAVSYGYSIKQADETARTSPITNWDASYKYDKATGKIIMTINSNDFSMGLSYTITVLGKDKNGTEKDITTIPSYNVPLVDLSSNAPDVYLSRVTEDSAEISIRKEVYPGNMEYKVVYTDAEGNNQEQEFSSFPLTISNFSNGNITIFQKYKNDAEFNATTKTLTVDSNSMKASIDLSIDGSSFNVTDLPEDTALIEIWNVTDTSQVKITEGKPGDILSTDLFAYGFFMAAAYKEDGSFAAYSNSVNAVLPIYIQETTPRQQSAVLTFKVAEGTDFSGATVRTDISEETPTISIEGNTASITVKGLTSKQSYEGSVSVIISGGTFTIPVSFTTVSFAGKYEWNVINPKSGNYATRFAVIVKDAPEVSNYKYYIYADPEIETNAENIRLMPLIDNLDNVDGFNKNELISYAGEASYQKAYAWNNKKWNSTGIDPSGWYISEHQINNDEFSTIVESQVFGFTGTRTTFTFKEQSNDLTLIFFNKIEGNGWIVDFANKSLYKNPDADSKDKKAPYTFTLSYTGAAE